MGRVRKLAIAVICALGLTGCAGMQYDKALNATPKGSDFSLALYDGYLGLATDEYKEGDFADSDQFAKYALLAADGEVLDPETIQSRDLPAKKIPELSGSRERLMKSLSAGARKKAPAQAARAQVMFDCWMQEQEENFQPKHIEKCRSDFLFAMNDLEKKVQPKQVAKIPAKRVVASYVVYFRFDSSKLTPGAMKTLKEAAAVAKRTKGGTISLSGHADSAGAKQYNLGLSAKRVDSVVNAMKRGGVSTQSMDLSSSGESRLAVNTTDGVRNGKNRRVEITILE